MENDAFVHDTETVFETENETDEDTTVTIDEKDIHETYPEDELEVGEEGDHEGDGEDDTIEELKIKM